MNEKAELPAIGVKPLLPVGVNLVVWDFVGKREASAERIRIKFGGNGEAPMAISQGHAMFLPVVQASDEQGVRIVVVEEIVHGRSIIRRGWGRW